MALTFAEAGKANSTTSSATLVVTSTVSFSVGDMVVVCIAADNNGTQGAASISSVTDSKSHTYTQRAIQNNDPAAAAAGATAAIYTAIVTTAMSNTDTITVNLSPNTTSKAAVVWKVTAGTTEFPKYLSNGGTTGSTANPQLASSSISSGDAVVYVLAAESNAALTGDSDTSNGSWATLYTDLADTGATLTSMRVGSQNKVVTGTATQTWNTTLTAADWAIAYAVIDPAARIQRTATGSGTGTQSATRSFYSILQRTATGSGTGSQTATGAKATNTVKRTATGSGTGTQTATGLHKAPRTATGSGTGTSTATASFFSILQRTATGSATGTETALGTPVARRTATGTGTGTSTATGLHSAPRTASGAGTGTGSADGQVVGGAIQRTATGAGTGTSTATGIRTATRTATGAGTGTGTADGQVTSGSTREGSVAGTITTSGSAIGTAARAGSTAGSSTSSGTVIGGDPHGGGTKERRRARPFEQDKQFLTGKAAGFAFASGKTIGNAGFEGETTPEPAMSCCTIRATVAMDGLTYAKSIRSRATIKGRREDLLSMKQRAEDLELLMIIDA